MTFRGWSGHFPRDVELIGVTLPGHWGRIDAPAMTRMSDLLAGLVPLLRPLLDRPFMFFGHSLGALVAFESLRALRQSGESLRAARLAVSACRAPHLPRRTPIHALPEADFIERVVEMGGMPLEMLHDRELLELLLPSLRADFELVETWQYRPEPPLDVPIVAYGGTDDPFVTRILRASDARQPFLLVERRARVVASPVRARARAVTSLDFDAAGAVGRLAALATAPGALTPDETSSLVDLVARLEPSVPSLTLTEQTQIAIDLHAVHARSTKKGAGIGSHAEEARQEALPARLVSVLGALAASSARRFEADQARIKAGGLRGGELIAWLARFPAEQRDMAVEHLFGIVQRPLGKPDLDPELVGYIPSGIAPVVQAVRQIPVGPEDIFVDIGSGLGKVAMAVHLLSGAEVRGIELQPELVAAARQRAAAFGLDAIRYEVGDARSADFSGASVIFLYLPFTGGTLDAAMRRVEVVARQRQLVVCTLGLDLGAYDWLRERATDELWLSIYDSCVPGVSPRPSRSRVPLGAAAEAVATERSMIRNADPEGLDP